MRVEDDDSTCGAEPLGVPSGGVEALPMKRGMHGRTCGPDQSKRLRREPALL